MVQIIDINTILLLYELHHLSKMGSSTKSAKFSPLILPVQKVHNMECQIQIFMSNLQDVYTYWQSSAIIFSMIADLVFRFDVSEILIEQANLTRKIGKHF